ncbi:Cyclic AMP-dependent transcription factor ATF-4 [Wickerhamomyces ciferrii]|uniref:Cyclic AMP-dependent transcription factor ATF-4 n=1 Tax=Wickerhamomyces ciferrii (strain ATCC 14091 / BCRC 22168 / CBS 111 / JCM 3599 / NBRC 0793 / NRRL Y-1031 F-60-10) TaxID=1206466 RepID=K0KEJ0_WICCF|nr:Cyclic AMP-dependent transcription factor ATF-4 [Wickerhamomyces ciferrii]CCH43555.1 Cyclic AMP-dependent transcription factor ATF-4 [Wickerhamomyces ciferrii]
MSNSNENITPAALLEQLVYVDTFMPEIDDPSQLDERLTAELSAFADESFIFPDEEKPTRNNNNNNNNNEDEKDVHNDHNRDPTNIKDEPTNHHEHLIKRFDEMNQRFASNPLSSNSNSNSNSNQPKTFNTLQQSNNLDSGISNILSPLQHNQNVNSSLLNSHSESLLNQFHKEGNNHDVLTNLPKVPVPPGAQSSLIAAGLSQTQIDALAALIAQHQGVDENGHKNSNSLSNLISPSQSLLNPVVTTPSSSSDLLSSNNNRKNSATSSNEGTYGNHSRSNSIVKLENSGDVDLDKRKRNTAASARFRIKKKLKEQQLERNIRELNELTLTLEKKIQTLEMENKLLRNLVVEKGEQKNNDELEYLKRRAKLSANNDQSEISNSNNENNGGFGTSSGTF